MVKPHPGVADRSRGFGDQAMYKSLLGAHMDFVIRFRDCIAITDAEGNTTSAAALVPTNGRGMPQV